MRETPKKSTLPATLSVGEVARRSGVTVPTLHFYESKGLIRAQRSPGNQRYYPRSVLRLISIIKMSQHLGMNLEQIKEHLTLLPQDHTPTARDWKKLTKLWTDELEERISMLRLLQTQLQSCIGCGCMSLSDCPLRNPQDTYAAKGPGAQIIREKLRK